jgi:hypothetical protein
MGRYISKWLAALSPAGGYFLDCVLTVLFVQDLAEQVPLSVSDVE